jgi:RNA polymerase sigma factor (sigma-70 family)
LQTGQKLQALRVQRGMTQEQLAERLFVSRELVSKWELGQRRPDIRLLREMASLFSVEIDDLMDTEQISDELFSCLPPDLQISTDQFRALLGPFLNTVSERDRGVFLRRYYYLEDAAAIGELFGIKENYVRSILARTRKKLKTYLKGVLK